MLKLEGPNSSIEGTLARRVINQNCRSLMPFPPTNARTGRMGFLSVVAFLSS